MKARAYMWHCPCCGDPGPWLSRWYEDHAYDGDRRTRVSCHHCGEYEWSNRTPERFTARWGHEWAAVAWMKTAHESYLSRWVRPVEITRFLEQLVSNLGAANGEDD